MDNGKEIKAGLKFLFIIACKEILHCEVKFCHSLDIGTRGIFVTKHQVNKTDINNITKRIYELINSNYPILKLNVSSKDAITYFTRYDETEKANSLNNAINETVIFNELLGNYNYFYSNIVDNTNKVTDFKIVNLGNNDFILIDNSKDKRDFIYKKNIFNEYNRYNEWINGQDIKYVCHLNRVISEGYISDFVKKNDIIVDGLILKLASDIVKSKKRIVFLGGPSSSGKTTGSRKLAIFINTLGKKTVKISLDDYYKEWNEIPEVDGKKDLESVNSLDLNLFEKHMKDLLEGKEVVLPIYSFQHASKSFNSDPITIDNNTIILVEGLHSLNETVSKSIEKRYKYKVYVSPFNPLSIDRHNYVSSSDNRLMRRIVRDYRTRGVSVEKTLETWQNVRIGEENNIFPYVDEADAVLNTSYIYEMGVLKVYLEPLLYTVNSDSPYYLVARRLLDSMKVFFPISSEYLASDNVLREFIGNSEFNER